MAKYTDNGTIKAQHAPHIRRVSRMDTHDDFEPQSPPRAVAQNEKHRLKPMRSEGEPVSKTSPKPFKAVAEQASNVGRNERAARIAVGVAATVGAWRVKSRWASPLLTLVAASAFKTGISGYCPITNYIQYRHLT